MGVLINEFDVEPGAEDDGETVRRQPAKQPQSEAADAGAPGANGQPAFDAYLNRHAQRRERVCAH